MKESSFVITNRAGQCRWCKCTELNACANGCTWANREQTLCSECVPLDTAMKTTAGRREVAEFVQEHGFPYRPGMIARAAAARPSYRPRKLARRR